MGDVSKFQRKLYNIFNISIIILFIANVIVYIIWPVNKTSLFLSLSVLLTTYMVIHNNRWSTITRIIYTCVYIAQCWKFGVWEEFFAKLLITLPFNIVKAYIYFPKRSQRISRLIAIRLRRNKRFTMDPITYYTVVVGTTGIMIGISVSFTNLGLKHAPFMAVLFTLCYLTNYYNLKYRINRWTFGILYNGLVTYVWIQAGACGNMILFNVFWLWLNLLGCIEAFYMREKGLTKSIFWLDVEVLKTK